MRKSDLGKAVKIKDTLDLIETKARQAAAVPDFFRRGIDLDDFSIAAIIEAIKSAGPLSNDKAIATLADAVSIFVSEAHRTGCERLEALGVNPKE